MWKGQIFGGQGLRWVSLLHPLSSAKSFPFKKMIAGNIRNGYEQVLKGKCTGEQLELGLNSNLDGVFDERPGEFCLESQTWGQKS